MKKLLFISICLSLVIISFSIAYYFVIYLPKNEKTKSLYETQIKKLQKKTSDLQNSVDSLNYKRKVDYDSIMEDTQNSIKEKLNQENQNKSNCESLGGRYQGDGLCVYH